MESDNMELPVTVLAVYGALVIWVGLLIGGVRKGSFWPFLGFGIVLMLVLNVRYFIAGVGNAIAFFVGIYDVLDNLGASESAKALASCPDNTCSIWGDRYLRHPAWGVVFYNRFEQGPELRRYLLYGHIFFNSVTFVLMHIQILRPGTSNINKLWHGRIGRVSFWSLTLGTMCACKLASEHGPHDAYGGKWSMYGFYSMSLCVYTCACVGVIKIRAGDVTGHQTWMMRFCGSMWGAFWLFRVALFVIGPLLRNYEAAAILFSIWFSAPLGVCIAEVYRTSHQQDVVTPTQKKAKVV
jgi:hypothetical protein